MPKKIDWQQQIREGEYEEIDLPQREKIIVKKKKEKKDDESADKT